MLLPRSVDEVARVLAICNRDEVAVVPHGGNTSYCGGATPDEAGSEVVISLKRRNRVREVDADNYSMIVETGCTLAEAQRVAHDAGRLFPLSLGSEGTAQIGGNLSTNAGGTAVLRYGMMRDLVLGLEVVLADGRVLHALKGLAARTTPAGDVKSLFVGAEGTLGVITAACLKLFPLPADTATAIAGIESPRHALDLLARLRGSAGDQVTSFELMPRLAAELTVKHIPGVANPLGMETPWYLLIELSSPNPRQGLGTLLTATLEEAAEKGEIADAMLATSIAQAKSFWKLRETIPEALPPPRRELEARRVCAGLGDPDPHRGGLRVDSAAGARGRRHRLRARGRRQPALQRGPEAGGGCAHLPLPRARARARHVRSGGGSCSISAEHGIGRLKVAELARRADPVELSLMHALKRALDPKGILNPGKVLCAPRGCRWPPRASACATS